MINGALVLESRGDADRIELPQKPSPEFTLRLRVERLDGTDALGIGLPVGDRRPYVAIDAFRGTISGLAVVDGKHTDSNETSIRIANVLAAGGPHEVICEVAPGRVKVTCDAQTIINWSGDTGRLSSNGGLSTPHSDQMFLTCYQTSFRISKIELEMSADAAAATIANRGARMEPRAPARAGGALRTARLRK